jgi:hypothetical protein
MTEFGSPLIETILIVAASRKKGIASCRARADSRLPSQATMMFSPICLGILTIGMAAALNDKLLNVQALWVGGRIVGYAKTNNDQVYAPGVVGDVFNSPRLAAHDPRSDEAVHRELSRKICFSVVDALGFFGSEELSSGWVSMWRGAIRWNMGGGRLEGPSRSPHKIG